MYCVCTTVILLHNVLSFKYYWSESIEILLLCSKTFILLLLLTETIQELYLNRMWRLDIRKSE